LAKVPHEELLGLVHPSGGIVIDENRLHTLALRTRRLLEDYVALRQEEFGHTEPARLENCCGLAAWLICRQLWRIAGTESELVYGHFTGNSQGVFIQGNHCWTEVGGRVVDITLTQYAEWYRPVEIMSVKVAREVGYRWVLRGSAAWNKVCCWDPGPLLVGRAVTKYIDRREKSTLVRPHPRHYGAPPRLEGAT
jgi:hypothetical protein